MYIVALLRELPNVLQSSGLAQIGVVGQVLGFVGPILPFLNAGLAFCVTVGSLKNLIQMMRREKGSPETPDYEESKLPVPIEVLIPQAMEAMAK